MKALHISSIIFLSAVGVFSCSEKKIADKEQDYLPITIVEENDGLQNIFASGIEARIIGADYEWTEGPLWVEKEQMLLFSEIPTNKVYAWKEGALPEVYLNPAGLTSAETRGGEVGSNGLLLDPSGKLVLCQHGERRLARMMAELDAPAPKYESVIAEFEGKRFNSPNDAIYDSKGNLYFTDPAYGLEFRMEDPKKEIDFQGVYRYNKNGQLQLLLDSISRPNGIALLPDEKHLLIANSDPEKPYWYLYELDGDKGLKNGKVFYDASAVLANEPGLPDGLKIKRMEPSLLLVLEAFGFWFEWGSVRQVEIRRTGI
ncbi:SMP-30/gluconolactonase/LRE family protein [Cyclobacterium qasimii]|uniref:Gluconolactonase n=1 Tax=Cyclobacterium qasimii M12-11B TaxID=641524 RepID=S7VLW0_9BACT|nr:SMP-30/gluconolactonase/LRE family protein [Cyclobacterium qasimii]EPR70931.1 Gluconolactonase [Cyclobacterium qasimii M12-11B]